MVGTIRHFTKISNCRHTYALFFELQIIFCHNEVIYANIFSWLQTLFHNKQANKISVLLKYLTCTTYESSIIFPRRMIKCPLIKSTALSTTLFTILITILFISIHFRLNSRIRYRYVKNRLNLKKLLVTRYKLSSLTCLTVIERSMWEI